MLSSGLASAGHLRRARGIRPSQRHASKYDLVCVAGTDEAEAPAIVASFLVAGKGAVANVLPATVNNWKASAEIRGSVQANRTRAFNLGSCCRSPISEYATQNYRALVHTHYMKRGDVIEFGTCDIRCKARGGCSCSHRSPPPPCASVAGESQSYR